MLSLQNTYVKDQVTKSILRESINRIRSMSVIHETLYRSKNFASINFSDYLHSITNEIIVTYPVLFIKTLKNIITHYKTIIYINILKRKASLKLSVF